MSCRHRPVTRGLFKSTLATSRVALLIPAIGVLAALGPAAFAEDFAPVSEAERQLEAVEWEPGAPAVVLFRDAELRLRDWAREANSRLFVRTRVKILTEEGVHSGVLEIPHSRYLRLGSLEGRTVTPDGREIPLPEDAVFREERSKSSRLYVTKVAFSSVTPGAILDLHYELFWDSFFYLEPWLFHQNLPVLRSTISYHKPDSLSVTTWGRQTGPQEMKIDTGKTPNGVRIDVAMENLGALPSEPYSFPAVDLSSRFMIVPLRIFTSGTAIELMADWDTVCDLFEDQLYREFMKGGRRDVKRRTEELTAGAKGTLEKAERLFAFVRDDIRLEEVWGVWTREGHDAGSVLEAGVGRPIEKALLLRAMLDAAKIESKPLWVADRRDGGLVADVANPAWFTGMILEIEVPGRSLYLDPTDRGNAAGTLIPYFENTVAVACGGRDPEVLKLPTRSVTTNRRSVRLDLALDAEGRLAGDGALLLDGHAAWRRLGVYEDAEAARKGWLERLGEQLPGFELAELTVEENIPQQQITVRFKMSQRDEDVLGDEASFHAAAPLARSQPFTVPVASRRTPVLMPFAMIDENLVEITWPEGWQPEVVPAASDHGGPAGLYSSTTEVDAEARSLRFQRTFSLLQHQFLGDEAYETVRQLFATASSSDAREIVFIRD